MYAAAPRVRCLGRTDDMLIVRGVNVFPSALRDIVQRFAPAVSGHILVRPADPGVRQVLEATLDAVASEKEMRRDEAALESACCATTLPPELEHAPRPQLTT